MRAAAQSDEFRGYFRDRNETIVTLLYNTGLRVNELVDVDIDMLDLDEGTLYIPIHIQKD